MRPTLGIFSFTSCSGCQLEIIHQEGIFLDLVKKFKILHFPMLQQKNELTELDVAVVEGSVSTKKQAERIKEIRDKTGYLIAIGACATSGGVNAVRNPANIKTVERLVYFGKSQSRSIKAEGLDKHVTVDYYVRGCPPVKEDFTRVVKSLLLGIKPFVYTEPVCSECRINENQCLLKEGTLCLGPITYGGCNAICPSKNLACDGCRGPTEDRNMKALREAVEVNGIPKKEIKRLIAIYNTDTALK